LDQLQQDNNKKIRTLHSQHQHKLQEVYDKHQKEITNLQQKYKEEKKIIKNKHYKTITLLESSLKNLQQARIAERQSLFANNQ
jgi:hypothetical protein